MNTATAIIESILEKPEDWTVTECTLDHKHGIRIWAANTWASRRIYMVGDKRISGHHIVFSDGEKKLLDGAITALKQERRVALNLDLDAEVLARLNGDQPKVSEETKWITSYYWSDGDLILVSIFACTLIFVMGMAFGATIGISMAKQSQAEVAPVSSQTN